MALFESLKNKKREYRNVLTGEIISKRQYDKYRRGGLSNEMSAKLEKVTNLDLALSRPARGRKSILKSSETEKELILEARKEDLQRRKDLEEKRKMERAVERKIARQSRKTVKRGKINRYTLKAGRAGARIPFNTYDEYVELIKDAQKDGNIHSYGLGIIGYHEDKGDERAITVFTQRRVARNEPAISREEFDEEMEDAINSKAYFIFQHYFMFLAYNMEYVYQKAKKGNRMNATMRNYEARRKTREGKI